MPGSGELGTLSRWQTDTELTASYVEATTPVVTSHVDSDADGGERAAAADPR